MGPHSGVYPSCWMQEIQLSRESSIDMLPTLHAIQSVRLQGGQIPSRDHLQSMGIWGHIPSEAPLWTQFHWAVLEPFQENLLASLPKRGRSRGQCAFSFGVCPSQKHVKVCYSSGQILHELISHNPQIHCAIHYICRWVPQRFDWKTSFLGFQKIPGSSHTPQRVSWKPLTRLNYYKITAFYINTNFCTRVTEFSPSVMGVSHTSHGITSSSVCMQPILNSKWKRA